MLFAQVLLLSAFVANVLSSGFHEACENGDLETVKLALNPLKVSKTDVNDGLLESSTNGHVEVVKFLLGKGADPKSNEDDSILWASYNGHAEVVEILWGLVDPSIAMAALSGIGDIESVTKLLNEGADVTVRENVAIFFASRNGHFEVVRLLLEEHGADPTTHDNGAIRKASENGHLEVVKYLLEKQCDPKAENNFAIRLASENGHLEVVNLLLAKADPKAEYNYAIRKASENGHLEVVKLLLEKECDPKAEDNYAIRKASENGHLEVVKLLLVNGADPKAMDNYAITKASENGHLEVVKLLLAKADPTANFNYAITKASENGHLEVVKLLLAKADPTANFNYAMKKASENGHLKVVKLLLAKADPTADNNYSIRKASENGHLEVVKLLLEKECNPKALDNYTIRKASENGHHEVVKLLLAKADPTADNNYAIRKASENGHLDVVKLLLAKADPTADNNYAIRKASANGHLEVVKFLLEKSNPEAQNNYAIRKASANGHLEVVKFLLEKSNPEAQNNYAIRKASENGHLKVVKLLLAKADPTADNNYAIRKASENGHLEVVKLLLEKECDPKAMDNYAIRKASENGHLEVVKLLLEKEYDPKAMDNYAIRKASENGHLEVVKLLLVNGADPTAENNYAIRKSSDTILVDAEVVQVLIKDRRVQELMVKNISQYDQLRLFSLSAVDGPFIFPGKTSLSFTLDLIDELCSVITRIDLEFRGGINDNPTIKAVSKPKKIHNRCLVNIDLMWPKDLASFKRGESLQLRGKVNFERYQISIIPTFLFVDPRRPTILLSHPTINDSEFFFMVENVNLKLDSKVNYCKIVDGNELKVALESQTLTFDACSNSSFFQVPVEAISMMKKGFEPTFSYTINGAKLSRSLKPISIPVLAESYFLQLPKRSYELNERIVGTWKSASYLKEFLKRKFSFKVFKKVANSLVELYQSAIEENFSVSALIGMESKKVQDPFGEYVVHLIDTSESKNGKIELAPQLAFSISPPKVETLAIGPGSSNSTIKVSWESPVCSSLVNNTIVMPNGTLNANLTVTLGSEPLYLISLDSYCILEHEFQIPEGRLAPNAVHELNGTLFDSIRNIILVSGNGTISVPQTQDKGEPQETGNEPTQEEESDTLKVSLIIVGVILGVAAIGVAVFLVIRRRRQKNADLI